MFDIIKNQQGKNETPEFVIVDNISPKYCLQAVFNNIEKNYDFEKKFYYSVQRDASMEYSYRYLYKK